MKFSSSIHAHYLVHVSILIIIVIVIIVIIVIVVVVIRVNGANNIHWQYFSNDIGQKLCK